MFRKSMKILLISTIFILILGTSSVMPEQYEGSLPKEFNQAPEFDQLVEKGELPPVEERLPEEPYVVEVNEKIGEYGGVIRTTTMSPEGYGDDTILSSWPAPTKPTADGSEIVPHLFKDWDVNEDYTEFTFYLREGVKWSDGHPFTVDDIMFWYEDILLNEELTSVVGPPWKVEGEIVEINKIDDYTVELIFPVSRPYFLNRSIKFGDWNFYAPKHYLKQFHPEYNSKKEAEKIAEEEGFDSWYQYFEDRNSNIWGMPFTTEKPGLTPYILERKSSNRRVWKRNPYFWKVDSEGNQLPYIEKIDTEIVSDKEVVQGKIMSGDIDYAVFPTDIRNYPMYREYENEGNYETILWESGVGSEIMYMLNHTHEDSSLKELFQNVKFKKALSLGIDREEINEAIYFGRARPRQHTVLDISEYYKPEYANSYIDYNPDRAKEMLKDIGLEDRNDDGWLEKPDGEKLNFTIEYAPSALPTPATPNVELVVEHWRALGIDVQSKAISGELQGQRAPGNMMDATAWYGDKATDLLFPIQAQFFVPEPPGWERTIWPEWGRWFQTDGEEGSEPPAEIKKLYGWYEQILREPEKEKRLELGSNILKMQSENLWSIGTVGDAPAPVIVNKNIVNFPEHGYSNWDMIWSMTRDPEQFFFEE